MQVIVILPKSSATQFGFIIDLHLVFVISKNCLRLEVSLLVMKRSVSGVKNRVQVTVIRLKRVVVRAWLEHATVQYENNRCELSHQPTRQQEKQMRKFKSHGQAQRFLSCFGVVKNLFRLGRHSLKAKHYRTFCDRSFAEWDRISCV